MGDAMELAVKKQIAPLKRKIDALCTYILSDLDQKKKLCLQLAPPQEPEIQFPELPPGSFSNFELDQAKENSFKSFDQESDNPYESQVKLNEALADYGLELKTVEGRGDCALLSVIEIYKLRDTPDVLRKKVCAAARAFLQNDLEAVIPDRPASKEWVTKYQTPGTSVDFDFLEILVKIEHLSPPLAVIFKRKDEEACRIFHSGGLDQDQVFIAWSGNHYDPVISTRS